jgi:hypothetical protein
MTTKTRRYLWVCALLMMLAVPIALVTLPTLLGSPADAARSWATSLSAKELEAASSNITTYPFAYRRAIMRMLAPERRSAVWRGHIEHYLRNHPNISERGAAGLNTVVEIFTPEFFSAQPPSEATLARLQKVVEEVKAELGSVDTRMLLERLGPEDSEAVHFNVPSILAFARSRLITYAWIQCECATQSDYCDDEWHCHFFAGPEPYGCMVDSEVPMCGTGWYTPCDGMCIPNH